MLTHCHFDHTGGAKELKEKLGIKIIAHHLDAKFLEDGNNMVTAVSWYGSKIQSFVVDRKLHNDNENIELGSSIIEANNPVGNLSLIEDILFNNSRLTLIQSHSKEQFFYPIFKEAYK